MSGSGALVRVADGRLEGRVAPDGTRSFLGIPYAAAPVGQARFRPPRAAAPWDGVRPATEFGPTVPKGRMSPHFEQMWPEQWIPGDDCLNLNVWSPPAGSGPAPVLVWIHGGGFTNGSGSSLELDGHAFAASGVVCVTINYRVGADGFLALGDGIANVGLQDQVAALEWVRDSIGAFGGDPDRVTLAGHSAGGSSVACLLTSERAQGLFGRAIVQSTSGIARLSSPQFAERVGADLARRLGVPPERAAIAQVDTADLLRAMSEQHEELTEWGGDAETMAPWAPVADGDLIPSDAVAAITAGRSADIPLLLGTLRDELRAHLTPSYLDSVTDGQLVDVASSFGLDHHGVEVYRSNRPGASAGDLLGAIETDWYFRKPIIELAEARLGGGAGKSWLYRFDRPRTVDNDGYGAAHGAEVPYIFNTTHVAETAIRVGPAPDPAVSAFMHGLWAEFIHGEDPPWTPYDLLWRTTGLLTDTVESVTDPDGIERTAWREFR